MPPPYSCHVFIDGGYVRVLGDGWKIANVDPLQLARGVVNSPMVQTWAGDRTRNNALLGRVTYYDGLPDDDEKTTLQEYWQAIELLPDVHLGFGALKGLKRPLRQKGVDTLIAVDMLVGAFSGLFDIAVLVAGDADFTPVVEEVRRRGVMVVVAASGASLSDDLRRVADRYVELVSGSGWLKPMGTS